ncbi:MAG: calcium-binding protein [Proteobacteria bacterium]|nr:calcium-binding protein [Pseudomonadota bacterium]
MPTSTNARTLYAQLMDDSDFLSQLTGIPSREVLVTEIQKYGKARGLCVSVEDIRQVMTSPERELSDQELEAVIGGKVCSIGDNTVFGGDDDVLIDDYFFGSNYLEGGAGHDTLFGLNGDDSMQGGDGHDDLYGGSGNDTMYGGLKHADSEDGSCQSDYMDGGSGNDMMYGGSGFDTMIGGLGNDTMDGGSQEDTMSGGSGSDIMYGGSGDDIMNGDAGDDIMNGGSHNDTMSGGAGNDYMDGGSWDDTMTGGDGNDTMHGGSGNDLLTGGAGSDVFVFGANEGSDTITDFTPGTDTFEFSGLSQSDLKVATNNGNTILSFNGTTVTLEGVEMTADEVWACRNTD